MICEEWRDIPGFEGIYQVSNRGRLKSFKEYPAGKIMKQTDSRGWYFVVHLQAKDRPSKTITLHRLVAKAFLPNPEALPEINHIDGNKQNNDVDNLEWCTRSHNIRHSIRMHPQQLDSMIHYNQQIRPRRVLQIAHDGLIVNSFQNCAEAARTTGICRTTIHNVASGKRNAKGYPHKTAGGFLWRFESEVIPT